MKGTSIIFVDPFGKEHDAIVTAENGLHPGFVSLVYVDVAAPEAENVRKVFDIPHVSQVAAETNPDLSTYHVNCWKYFGDSHNAPPDDHAQHDHPFKYMADQLKAHQDAPQPTDGEDEMLARRAASAAAAGQTLQAFLREGLSGPVPTQEAPSAADLADFLQNNPDAQKAMAAEETGSLEPGVGTWPVPISGGPGEAVPLALEGVVHQLNTDNPANMGALDKLKAAITSFPHKEPDVTAQLEADAKAADADATGTP
jgi:hypothetical protein